jgi:hypothetical protein
MVASGAEIAVSARTAVGARVAWRRFAHQFREFLGRSSNGVSWDGGVRIGLF